MTTMICALENFLHFNAVPTFLYTLLNTYLGNLHDVYCTNAMVVFLQNNSL